MMRGLMMDVPLSIDRILEHACRLHPLRRISTKRPDGTLQRSDWRSVHARARRLGRALDGLGIRPGDRVASFAWNTQQHLELYYGIPGAGAVCHTLNLRLSAEELAWIVDHAEDRVVFVDGTLLPLIAPVAARVKSVERWVVIDAPPGAEPPFGPWLDYETLLAEADEDFAWRVEDERQAAALCYTSGTTGRPKGVLYSHRSTYLHATGINQPDALAIAERDVVLPVVPMFHAMAWGLPYACALAGAELVMPGPHLKPEPLAELIETERVTVPAGVPTIWAALVAELKAHPRDLSRIRTLVVGGAAMPRAAIAEWEALGVPVLHAWGMTETSPLGTASVLRSSQLGLPLEQRLDLKAKQGRPVPGVEVRLVGDDGQQVAWDGATMGELQVRGPWVASAYYRVEPSEESFTADGWFRTGDVATIGADGFMQITDRTKDLVKSGGEWISSVALENALMAHPGVREAAVIGIPDERWGERPLAVVVRAGDPGPDAEALRAHLAAHFASFQVPERVSFVAEIPKTSVGKFDKKRLRRLHAEGGL